MDDSCAQLWLFAVDEDSELLEVKAVCLGVSVLKSQQLQDLCIFCIHDQYRSPMVENSSPADRGKPSYQAG